MQEIPYLNEQAGLLPFNRPLEGWGRAVEQAAGLTPAQSAEAEEFIE